MVVKGKTGRKLKPRTYVYPYESLKPIVEVDADGEPRIMEGFSKEQIISPDLSTKLEDIKQSLKPILDLLSETSKVSDIERAVRYLDTLFNEKFTATTNVAETDADMMEIRKMIGEINSTLEILNEKFENKKSADRPLDKIQDLIMSMGKTVKERIAIIEGNISSKLDSLESSIAGIDFKSSDLNTKEVIRELQKTESSIMESVDRIKNSISRDLSSRVETSSLKLTDVIIELDRIKETIIMENRKNRDNLLEEIKKFQNMCLDNQSVRNMVRDLLRDDTDYNRSKMVELLKANVDTLSQSNRREIQDLKESMEEVLKSVSERTPVDLTETISNERAVVSKLIEELKEDTRKQIDRITESMVPREDSEESKQKIRDLENELSETKLNVSNVEGKLNDSRMINENLSKENTELKNQTLEKQSELLSTQSELQRISNELEDTLMKMKKSEPLQLDFERLMNDYKQSEAKLKDIEGKVENILQKTDQVPVTNPIKNLETLEAYLNTIIKNQKKICKVEPMKKVIPRYAVFTRSNDIIELINLDKPQENFKDDILRLKNDLFGYISQVFTTYEYIRRAVYDSEYIYYVRSKMLTWMLPSNIDDLLNEYMTDLIPVVTDEESEKEIIGNYVLSDVFSPTIDPNMTSNSNIVVASGIMKVFNYKDAIELVISKFDGYISRSQTSLTLKRLMLTSGNEIPGSGRVLYDISDMYKQQIIILDDIKEYIEKLIPEERFSREAIINIEIRMILLDAFMKAFLEMKNSIDNMKAYYGNKSTGLLELDDNEKLISYVRLRADGNLIDQRYSILVNNSTSGSKDSKLQISHQPFVYPSMAMGDVDTGFYQHDMYGPFTRVFLPNKTNNIIANEVTEIVDNLNKNKDVCTLSLGPSGSGKTSTLLYFRGANNVLPSRGVIPLMMNKLDSRFTKVRVTAFEFTANYEATGYLDYWRKYNVFDNAVYFTRESSEWVSNGDISIETFSYDTAKDICEADVPFRNLGRGKRNLGRISVGDFMSKLIDIRLNCGTPLNPVSSRTHLFLFMKFMSDSSEDSAFSPTLIIADLAGREKTFDCNSEAILEIFSLNKYYPTLNRIVNNPLEVATEDTNPMFSTPVSEQFRDSPDEEKFRSREMVSNIVKPLSEYNLKSVFRTLQMDLFFRFIAKPGEKGYVVNKERTDIMVAYYKFLARVSTYLMDMKFHENIVKRLETLDSQPLELRNVLEKIDNSDTLEITKNIIEYFASEAIKPGINILAQTQFARITKIAGNNDSVKTRLALNSMKDYLQAILLIDFLLTVIKDKPAKVCGYRNIEGEFINRSLDEFSNLVMLAASSDNNGPKVHAECLPVTCSFAGMDCLLPKNVPRNSTPSALAQILKEGTGKPTTDMSNMVFCVFVIVNLTRNPANDKIYRAPFDSAETSLNEVVQSFESVKANMEFLISGQQSTTDEMKTVISIFSGAYDTYMDAYSKELELRKSLKERLEYRGVDPRKMINDGFKKSVYRESVNNWTLMRNSQKLMMFALSDKKLLRSPSQFIIDLDSKIRRIKEFVEILRINNQDSSMGVLSFADDLVKMGLQPMVCSSFDSREEILKSNVGWANVQSKI